MANELLENLNESQLEAVTHKEGPLMIIAGAGTGKTTVVTQRIAWLIEQQHAKPDEILALTFTDKAAGEMEERVDRLLPIGYVDLWISTFHSFCERILRAHAADIGLPIDFQLLDEVQTLLLVRRNIDRFNLDYYRPRGNPTRFVRALMSHFSRAKDENIPPNAYLEYAAKLQMDADTFEGATSGSDGEELTEAARMQELASAYHTYQQLLLENDALDFADLIFYTIELFRKRPAIRAKYQAQFKYILVDEFQDTNLAQYELVKLLCRPPNNLTVVGDDDQSIYKFRGASLSNIMLFREDFTDAHTVVLTHNYRSFEAILDHAHTLIQFNNPNRLESTENLSKKLTSVRAESGHVHYIPCYSEEDEVQTVLKKIAEIKTETDCAWSDFSILVRANSHADACIQALERSGVPYRFLARSGLYAKPVILDCLAWMRVLQLVHDSPPMFRILSHPELGITEENLAHLSYQAKRGGTSLYNCFSVPAEIDDQARKRLFEIQTLIRTLTRKASRLPVNELFVKILKETGILGYVQSQTDAVAAEQYSYLNQFYKRLKAFETRSQDKTLQYFLEEFEHERQAGEVGSLPNDVEDGPDVVNVMTIHASKGLEFRYVFLVNLIEGRFPSRARSEAIPIPEELSAPRLQTEGNPHVEEERRLFYVALTRARDELFLLHAEDYGGARARKPSRFLAELGLLDETAKEQLDSLQTLEPKEKEETTEAVDYTLPPRVSFTQLAAFSSCPLQYKYAHILKVPVFGKHQLSFGKTMHNTLHAFLNECATGGATQVSLFDQTTPDEITLPPFSDLLSVYDRYWIDEWYPDEDVREEYKQQGRASLKAYHDTLKEQPLRIAYLEKDFSLKIGSITVKGRIDRIDECEDGYEIIDYKTGSPKTKLSWQDKRQLILYTLALESCFDPPLTVKQLSYHYLEDGSITAFEPTDKDREKLTQEILTTVEKIKESDFTATPGFHCQFCDFKEICEFADV